MYKKPCPFLQNRQGLLCINCVTIQYIDKSRVEKSHSFDFISDAEKKKAQMNPTTAYKQANFVTIFRSILSTQNVLICPSKIPDRRDRRPFFFHR